MDSREFDLLKIETMTKIFALDETIPIIEFFNKILKPKYNQKSTFIFIQYFQKIDQNKIINLTFDDIYNYSQNLLLPITDNVKYIFLLSLTIFLQKENIFQNYDSMSFIINKIKENYDLNIEYTKNTNEGYLASEFNITLLRIYNSIIKINDSNIQELYLLINKQKQFNEWVLDYLKEI